jgi:hypothetical protein
VCARQGNATNKTQARAEFCRFNKAFNLGCGDSCPNLPGRRYEELVLPDPAGQPLHALRPIRDEIERRMQTLLEQLGIERRGGR